MWTRLLASGLPDRQRHGRTVTQGRCFACTAETLKHTLLTSLVTRRGKTGWVSVLLRFSAETGVDETKKQRGFCWEIENIIEFLWKFWKGEIKIKCKSTVFLFETYLRLCAVNIAFVAVGNDVLRLVGEFVFKNAKLPNGEIPGYHCVGVRCFGP